MSEGRSDNNSDTDVIDAMDAARMLGVSKGLIYKLLDRGELWGFAVGKRKKIYRISVERYRLAHALGSPKSENATEASVDELFGSFSPTAKPSRKRKKKS